MNQGKNYVDRKFGHCIVNWELKNFCTFWHDENERLTFSSPDFYVRTSPPTKWRMTLNISKVIDEDEGIRPILFELKRLEYKRNSQLVSADCMLAAEDSSMDEWKHFKHNFLPNSLYRTDEIEFMQNDLLHSLDSESSISFDPKALKFTLSMVVHFSDSTETFSECSDSTIKNLSEDLCSLYETGQRTDIRLKVGNQHIQAHKPILCSRMKNDNFKNNISSAGEEFRIYYADNYNAWDSLIRFLYSANMDYAVKEPSLSVYEGALDCGIEPIVAYYKPDTLNLHSTKDIEHYVLAWTISNFFDRTDTILTSPPITTDVTGINCRFKIYPRGLGGKKRKWTGVYIDIEAVDKDICVEFFVDTPDGYHFFYQRHRRLVGREVFGDEVAIKRDTLKDYVQNGSLTLGFFLRITTGIDSNLVGKLTTVCMPFSEQMNYINLSNDIMSLYEAQKYTDVDPAANSGLRIKFHECILSARCMNGLREAILEGFPDNTEVIESGAFEHLLHFLYSGRLNRAISLKSAFVLYAVGKRFHMGTLERAIIDHLLEILDTQNAEDIYEFAESKNIVNLKNSAFIHLGSVAKRK